MALDRKTSVGVGLAAAGLVWAIYYQTVPRIADVRVAPAGDRDIHAAEKAARWTSAGLVVALALITMDATVAVIGGSAVVAESWLYRHANTVDPTMGKAYSPQSREMIHVADSAGYTPDVR